MSRVTELGEDLARVDDDALPGGSAFIWLADADVTSVNYDIDGLGAVDASDDLLWDDEAERIVWTVERLSAMWAADRDGIIERLPDTERGDLLAEWRASR